MNDTALQEARDFSGRLAGLLRREHSALVDFLHRELRLSRGAAHYRKVAARLVRRFFGLSSMEARALAAELDPEVLRQRTVVRVFAPGHTSSDEPGHVISGGCAVHTNELELRMPSTAVAAAPRPTAVEPMTATASRIHLTVPREFVTLLRKAKAGEAHTRPHATDADVLVEGLKLLLEKQSRRKAGIPARVKREVMNRDGARCQWPLHDGSLCGATTHLEIDHVHPRARPTATPTWTSSRRGTPSPGRRSPPTW